MKPKTFAEMVAGKKESPHGVPPRRTHPVADAFPMIAPEDWPAFVADIKANGQRDLITLHADGRIIDGRNRYAACLELGVRPKTDTFMGSEEAIVAFVASKNLHRRHLDDPNQRAFIAATLANMKREDGGEFGHLGNPHPPFRENTEGGSRRRHVTEDPLRGRLISQADAAAALNVKIGKVEYARAIESYAPELKDKVLSGEVSLSSAAKTAQDRGRAKKSGQPPAEPRHEVHKKKHHRNQTAELDRALTLLGTVVSTLSLIEPGAVDSSRRDEWITAISAAENGLRNFRRSLKNGNSNAA